MEASLNIYRRAPRYSAVAASLFDDIEKGRYPVGAPLPTEAELRRHYGVSRHTVREALRELKDLGLITSRAGVGTHVRAKPGEQNFIHGVSTIDELLQVVESTEQEVICIRDLTADAEWAGLLRCGIGRRWLELRALRRVAGKHEAIGIVTAYIPPEYERIVPEIETSHKPIFRLIEEHGGAHVVEIRQEIVATTLDAEQAEILHASAGDKALKIIRHHLDANDQVTQAAIGIYPEGRSSYVTRFRVHRGANNDLS